MQLCIPPLFEMLCFKAHRSEYPVCSDWSAHTRLSNCAKSILAWKTRHRLVMRDSDEDDFRSFVFCGRENILLVWILTF